MQELLPSVHGHLLKQLSLVVNDDDLGGGARLASYHQLNGQLIQSYNDEENEPRKALYTLTGKQEVPAELQH